MQNGKRETGLAFQIADRIISIQECDEGYDYSIMNQQYREIGGGIYDNLDISIREALQDIVDDLKQNPDTNGAKGMITEEEELITIDFDASIRGVVLSGSRCRGLEGKQSDLDVVVEYVGNEREDDMFNLLHEDKFSIDGVKIDINPITAYKTGSLEEYLPGVEKYLEEKSQKVSVREKLREMKMEIRAKDEKGDKGRKKIKENVR